MRADFAGRLRAPPRDEWVAELGPADTCVARCTSVPELVEDRNFA